MSLKSFVKSFFEKIKNSITDFWNSDKVEEFREDFVIFTKATANGIWENIMLPFIKSQVKQYAVKTITGEMKFKEVKKNLKENFKNIEFSDAIAKKIIDDVVWELKMTKEI